ncbi:hypothetical protein BDZ97DRAFT_1852590 [Flammula alnicola]|nr:hypothetical protein BDZ97DRAFT_1852590 [Flammula alnicola]
MADIRYDGEAMLHQMPTSLISSHSKFVSVLDKDRRPLVFCASHDLKFTVLQANSTGSFVLIDLSAKLNISGDVQAIAVAQHQESLLLHIAVATGSTSTQSQIHILKPIAPDFIGVTDADLRKASLPQNTSPQNVRITDFHINSALKQGQWPLLVALWRPASGGAQDDAKVARVTVLADRWEWSTDLGLPQTVKDILAVCTLQTRLDEAIAYLYKYNNVKSIIVTSASADEDDKFYTQLELPTGADPRGLGSVLDSGGKSILLVSGNGLYGFTPSQIVRSNSTATRISSDPLYSTASHLTVAQTGQNFSLWFRTDDQILGYQCGNVEAQTPQGTGVRLEEDSATPLLSRGSAVDFSPLLDSKSKSQSLVVLGESDQVLLMTQSGDTKMWKSLPLMIENTAKVTEVQAFVSHIEVKDADGLPVALGDYTLSSSGWTKALINGRESVLDSHPVVVRTNERGIITIVVPTEDISSYFYTIDNSANAKPEHRLRNSHTFDPSKKMQDRLGTAFAGKSLRDIDTPEGKLLEGSKATDEDIREAEKALKQMPDALKDLGNKRSTAAASFTPPTASSIEASLTTSHVALGASTLSNWWDKFKKKAQDAWEWVKHKAKEIKDWVFQKINDAWHFVVRIAGEAWAFILDSVTAVVKAVTWILEKIGAAFKKIWAWVSWIFNIQDLKNVASSLRTMFDASLVYAESFVRDQSRTVDTWADGLEAKLLKSLNLKLPDELARKQSPKSAESGSGSTQLNSVSAPANVGFYHLEQGKHIAGSFGSSNPIALLWQDIIKPIVEELQTDLKVIGDQFSQLLTGGKNTSVVDIMSKIAATIIHTLAQCLKKLVTGLINLGADLIGMVKDFINTPLSHFPVLAPILKALGFNVTIMDIVVYVLAVPVTVFAKIISGQPPRRITSFDYKALVDGGLKGNDNALLAYSELASYLGITEAFFETLYKTYKIAAAEIPTEPETFSAIGLTFDLILAAITFPYDRESPGWEFSLSVWCTRLVNKLVRAACVKAKAPPKLTVVIDVAVAIAVFSLMQAVHHYQIEVSQSVWAKKDDALIGFSISTSIFELVEAASGTVGVVAVDPVTKGGAIVIVAACGASRAVIKTGKSVREHELKRFG